MKWDIAFRSSLQAAAGYQPPVSISFTLKVILQVICNRNSVVVLRLLIWLCRGCCCRRPRGLELLLFADLSISTTIEPRTRQTEHSNSNSNSNRRNQTAVAPFVCGYSLNCVRRTPRLSSCGLPLAQSADSALQIALRCHRRIERFLVKEPGTDYTIQLLLGNTLS